MESKTPGKKDISQDFTGETKSGQTTTQINSQETLHGNTTIVRYNKSKRAIFFGLIFFVLFSVAYTLSLGISNPLKAFLTTDGTIITIISNGKIVGLLTANQGFEQMLTSYDSGKTFFASQDKWKLTDTAIQIAIAPDSLTVVSIDQRGTVHVKLPGSHETISNNVKMSATDSVVRGFVFVPGTDTVYAYGQFPAIIAFDYKRPGITKRLPLYSIKGIYSLAISKNGNIACIADNPLSGAKAIYYGNAFNNLAQWLGGFIFTDTSHLPNNTARNDSAMVPHIFSIYQSGTYDLEQKINFEPITKTWYHQIFRYPYSAAQYLSFPAIKADSLFSMARQNYFVYARKYFFANISNKVLLNAKADPIFYGDGPYIETAGKIDSIGEGGNIQQLQLVNGEPVWALVTNNNYNYLYQHSNGNWVINPVLVKQYPIISLSNYLLFFMGVCALFISYQLFLVLILRAELESQLLTQTEINSLLTKSEKPLGLDGEDLLGFEALEKAIMKIIQNPQLQLPMTIVVSGSWGSGKSSMMNRIRENIQTDSKLRKRFMTTWFNAWHLQGESSLLNAFLLNIINCYERYYRSWSGFRLNLAAKRYARLGVLKKFGFGFAAAVLLPFLFLPFLIVLPGKIRDNFDWVNNFCENLSKIFLSSVNGINAGLIPPVLGGGIILFCLFFVGRQYVPAGLSAFFQLIPKNNFKLEVENVEAGGREKFRAQYWEIMGAARKGTRLVVFIDDVDRIGGDKILELLEGINFISDIASRPPGTDSSVVPNTIFIIGMYTQEVARLVGTQLSAVNKSTVPPEKLGAFYIEKMVQLIVPVPFDNADQQKIKKLYENY